MHRSTYVYSSVVHRWPWGRKIFTSCTSDAREVCWALWWRLRHIFAMGRQRGREDHRCGDAWWRSLAGRHLGIASGGLRASLDLTAAHSGWKRVRGGQSRAVDGGVVMAASGGALGDYSNRRLDSRQWWRERKGGSRSCSANPRGNGSDEGGRVASPRSKQRGVMGGGGPGA
jgi:hypothetical protein